MVKFFFHTLKQNKFFSTLNIFALAVGICCAGLIFLWAEDELTYDAYHKNADQIYILKNFQTYEGSTFTFDATPGPLVPAVRKEFTGIKAAARSFWPSKRLIAYADNSFNETGLYVDADYLKIFTVEWASAKPSAVFANVNTIYISESVAKKMFGSASAATGKAVKIANEDLFTIEGVFKDLPENVTYRYDWLMPFEAYEKSNAWVTKWNNNGVMTFIMTNSHSDVTALRGQFRDYLKSKQEDSRATLDLYPMKKWHLYNNFINGVEEPGRIRYVRLFSFAAWIILLIACINFMNLSTARSERTAKEIGIRKTLGASRQELIIKLIGQSVAVSFVAGITAIVLMNLLLPFFNELVEKRLTLRLGDPFHFISLVVICLLCGVAAGSYPAVFLSRFEPAPVLKGVINKSKAAGNFRKGLVIFQFSISLILIISTVLILRQLRHVQSRELGFAKENLVYTVAYPGIKKNLLTLKQQLHDLGIADHAALSSNVPFKNSSNSGGFSWKGKDGNSDVLIAMEYVSDDYFKTAGIDLLSGRDFKTDALSDSNNIIINESFATLLKTPNPIGMQIIKEGDGVYTIVGVIKNHFFNDMYNTPGPMVYYNDPKNSQYLSVRFKSGISEKGMKKLSDLIKSYNPAYPVELRFADEEFGKLFKTETLLGKISMVFSVLVIIIACLGLFGLAAFTAERKTKEMGIRKVLGASVLTLAAGITKEFLLLILIACLVSFPIAALIMRDWLSNYAYRIDIEWWVFVTTMFLGLVICLITVGYQALKVALLSPVKILRNE